MHVITTIIFKLIKFLKKIIDNKKNIKQINCTIANQYTFLVSRIPLLGIRYNS